LQRLYQTQSADGDSMKDYIKEVTNIVTTVCS
jgi:hypothetical protein